jgi:hypothetical protein
MKSSSPSPETLPTDPSLMDLSFEAKAELGSLPLPFTQFTAVLPRKPGSKSSESPPANEDSPNSSDPYYSRSQSQSKSEQRSPPAFYCTRPRQLHQRLDWPRSGSRTWRTGFGPEPDPMFRFRFMDMAGPNIYSGSGSTHCTNQNLMFEPEPQGPRVGDMLPNHERDA